MKKIVLLVCFQILGCRSTGENSTPKEGIQPEPEVPDLSEYVGCYEAASEGMISAGVEVANDADRVCIENNSYDQLSFVFEKAKAAKEDGKFLVTYAETCGEDCIQMEEGTLIVQLTIESSDETKLSVSDSSGQTRYMLTRAN
ncbi:MAG: hypothetical protein AB7T49_14100 [Oligoflexales bacterium]